MSGLHDLTSYRRRLQDKRKAEHYARRFEEGSRLRIDRREQRAVQRVFQSLPDCGSVLDVPSGAGRFARTLSEGGRTVLEMDVAFEILEFAQGKVQKAQIHGLVLQGDASKLPLGDGSVDCVFSNRLLHHILPAPERQAILREFHRVSRRWTVVSFFNYKGLARIRRFLKSLKGRRPPYEKQPTLEEFGHETAQAGFRVREIASLGPFWVSQKYFVLEKN